MHKIFPKNLVVFRDGVSEGEYAQLENSEIQSLEGILYDIDGMGSMVVTIMVCLALLADLQQRTGHKTNLIFIVVGKRCVSLTCVLRTSDNSRRIQASCSLLPHRPVMTPSPYPRAE